jgi:hypothetical protein
MKQTAKRDKLLILIIENISKKELGIIFSSSFAIFLFSLVNDKGNYKS